MTLVSISQISYSNTSLLYVLTISVVNIMTLVGVKIHYIYLL